MTSTCDPNRGCRRAWLASSAGARSRGCTPAPQTLLVSQAPRKGKHGTRPGPDVQACDMGAVIPGSGTQGPGGLEAGGSGHVPLVNPISPGGAEPGRPCTEGPSPDCPPRLRPSPQSHHGPPHRPVQSSATGLPTIPHRLQGPCWAGPETLALPFHPRLGQRGFSNKPPLCRTPVPSPAHLAAVFNFSPKSFRRIQRTGGSSSVYKERGRFRGSGSCAWLMFCRVLGGVRLVGWASVLCRGGWVSGPHVFPAKEREDRSLTEQLAPGGTL